MPPDMMSDTWPMLRDAPLRALLSMRSVFAFHASPHPEEAQSAVSKDVRIGQTLRPKGSRLRRQGDPGFGATSAPESVSVPDYHFTTLEAFADAVEEAERNT